MLWILEQCRATACFDHFLYRTATIEVEMAEAGFPEPSDGLNQKRFLGAKELNDQWRVLWAGQQEFTGARAAVNQSFGTDHFRYGHATSLFAAKQTERQVRKTSQRREPRVAWRDGQTKGIHTAGVVDLGWP